MTLTTDAAQTPGLSEGLFPISDAWGGDPIRPGLTSPTPSLVVASLSKHDRALRVRNLTKQAHEIYDDAIATHLGKKTLTGTVVMVSGGNDSMTLLHIFRRRLDAVGSANTTIGVEETRQFVRDICTQWGLRHIEKYPPTSYEDLVLKPYRNKDGELRPARGFPGPARHNFYYHRLKERCFEQIRNDFVNNYRTERVCFVFGRRRAESAIRGGTNAGTKPIPIHERKGSIIKASPLSFWTKLDLNTYADLHDVPRNHVSGLLHRSAECDCGSNAKPGELEELEMWFPEEAAYIHDLERRAREAGIPEPYCRWGHGKGSTSRPSLCNDCSPLGEML